MKLFESELKVMEILWERGDTTAKEISQILNAEIGWNINTTYTVIKKCISKGAIERYGNNYICKPLIKKKDVQQYETKELINKMFNGSKLSFFNSFLNDSDFTNEELDDIKNIINKLR